MAKYAVKMGNEPFSMFCTELNKQHQDTLRNGNYSVRICSFCLGVASAILMTGKDSEEVLPNDFIDLCL